MTFNEYWQQLTERNAALADDENKMRISVASFKSQLEKAWFAAKGGNGKVGQVNGRFQDLFETMGDIKDKMESARQ